jgi:hypothetical protein
MDPIIAFEIAGLLLIVGYVLFMRWSDARGGIKLSGIVPVVAGMIFTKLALTATTSPAL